MMETPSTFWQPRLSPHRPYPGSRPVYLDHRLAQEKGALLGEPLVRLQVEMDQGRDAGSGSTHGVQAVLALGGGGHGAAGLPYMRP